MKLIQILLPPDRKDTFENGKKYSDPNCSASILLITDDNKKIIFDTGAFGYAQKLIAALKQHELTPQEIDYVILSHAHFDHNSNLYLFENAQLLYSKWSVSLRDGKTEKSVTEVPDILPEGITFLQTAGHSEDSISVLCEYQQKKYAIVGDAVKISLIKSGVLKGYSNPQLYLKNMKRLFEIADIIISGEDGIIEGQKFEEIKQLLSRVKVDKE